MSSAAADGGLLNEEKFRADLKSKIAGKNEERLIENAERIILENKRVKQKVLGLEGIDTEKHDSEEVRQHLYDETKGFIYDLYELIENGKVFELIEKYLGKVERLANHPPIENCKQFGELLKNKDGIVPEKFKNLLVAMGSTAAAGVAAAIGFIYMSAYMPDVAMSYFAIDFAVKASPAMIMALASTVLLANAKMHLEEIDKVEQWFDNIYEALESLEGALKSALAK